MAAEPAINVFVSSHIPIILQSNLISLTEKKRKQVIGDKPKFLLQGIPWHQPSLHTSARSAWFDKAHRKSADKSLHLLSQTVWQESIMNLSHSYNLTIWDESLRRNFLAIPYSILLKRGIKMHLPQWGYSPPLVQLNPF